MAEPEVSYQMIYFRTQNDKHSTINWLLTLLFKNIPI